MHILMVIPSFFPVVGGAERQLLGLANYMSSGDLEVTIFTRSLEKVSSREFFSGTLVIRAAGFCYPYFFLVRLFFHIIKNRKKYSIIHVHTLNSPMLVSVLAGFFLKIPVIVKVTRSGKGSQLARIKKSVFYGTLSIVLFKVASRVIAITSDVRSSLINLGVPENKIVDIPNGVEVYAGIEKQYKSIKFVYIGRLIKRKRVDLLLSCWADADTGNRSKLEIIGGGPELERLKKLACKLNINSSVEFSGCLPHAQIMETLDNSQVFVLPSDSEGMSNALLEAMSFGNAVIVARIDANNELVMHKKTGLNFDTKEDLVKSLALLAKNSNEVARLSQEAKSYVTANFSFQTVANAYIELYRELCSERAN